MKVFIAGATGALGAPLVRELVARGHEVVGLTRSPEKRALIEQLGASAAVADALDGPALELALLAARPTHVVHLLAGAAEERPDAPKRHRHHQRAEDTRDRQPAAGRHRGGRAADRRRVLHGDLRLS